MYNKGTNCTNWTCSKYCHSIFIVPSFWQIVQIVQTEQTLNTSLSWISNIQRCETNEQSVQSKQSQNTNACLDLKYFKL